MRRYTGASAPNQRRPYTEGICHMIKSSVRRPALTGLVAASVILGGVVTATASSASATATPVRSRTVLVISPTSLVTGQQAYLRSVVHKTGTGVSPTGTVTFLDGTTVIGTTPLSMSTSGTEVAQLAHPFTAGPHTVTAHYNGNTTYAPSTSAPDTVTVAKAKTLSKLPTVKATKPGTYNVVIAETAVEPGDGVPTGTASIQIDGHAAQTVTLSTSGHAHVTVALSKGRHTAKIAYGGDSNFIGNTAILTFTV